MQCPADVFTDRASREKNKLHYFLPNLFGVRPAYRKAFSALHFYHHAAVKVAFNFFQIVNIDNGRTVHADKSIGVHDFFQLANTRGTDKLIGLRGNDGVITRRLKMKNLLYG